MSNPYEQLSTYERLPLEIEGYKEQAAAWKHEDNFFQRFTSVILPVSIAALGLPYVRTDVPVLLLTIGGLILMTFWIISCQTMRLKSKIRLSIIRGLEKTWNIKGHNDFKAIRESTYPKKLGGHYLRCCMFWVYLVIVIGLTAYRWYESYSPQKGFTTEFIDLLIIVGVIAIVSPFVGWAMCKARIEPSENST